MEAQSERSSINANLPKSTEEDDATSTHQEKNVKQQGQRVECAEEEVGYLEGLKLFTLMAVITFVFFLALLDTSIIATAIPRITNDFHSLPDVGWYGAAYLLASCSLQPLTGKLYMYLNSKYLFLTFFAIFELGSLLCGVAQSSTMLIIGRAVAGMGVSGIANGALSIIAASVPLERRPAMTGIMIGLSQTGIVLGPLIGGALTEYTTWRWCFYINLPPGAIVAAVFLSIKVPDITTKSENNGSIWEKVGKLDLFGFALFAPAAIQALLALEWGGSRYSWNSSIIIGLFCGAAGTLLIFLAWEYHVGDGAMIPLSIVRQRIVWCGCLYMFFVFSNMLLSSYYLPVYFQGVRNATPLLSGVYILPTILGQIILGITSGLLVSKLGYYLPWAVACGILASIGSGLISTFTQSTSTGTWIGYQIIGGVGRGAGLQMGIVALQSTLPRTQIPIGMSLLVFSQNFGGAVMLAAAETIFSNTLSSSLASNALGVDAQRVIKAGATAWRQVVRPDQIGLVLVSYSTAIQSTFYLATGCGVAVFMLSWGLGWKSVKKVKAAKKGEV